MRREPPVIADTATSLLPHDLAELLGMDDGPHHCPLCFKSVATPEEKVAHMGQVHGYETLQLAVADVPHGTSEADQRIDVGADTWLDRHPAIAVISVAFIGLSLLGVVIYAFVQARRYLTLLLAG